MSLFCLDPAISYSQRKETRKRIKRDLWPHFPLRVSYRQGSAINLNIRWTHDPGDKFCYKLLHRMGQQQRVGECVKRRRMGNKRLLHLFLNWICVPIQFNFCNTNLQLGLMVFLRGMILMWYLYVPEYRHRYCTYYIAIETRLATTGRWLLLIHGRMKSYLHTK